jgi:hypothetical protein
MSDRNTSRNNAEKGPARRPIVPMVPATHFRHELGFRGIFAGTTPKKAQFFSNEMFAAPARPRLWRPSSLDQNINGYSAGC